MTGLSHRDDMYETPLWLVYHIMQVTGLKFNLDICANEQNKKCHDYISKEEDALKVRWKKKDPTVAICNPPTSINGKMVTKANDEWKRDNFDLVMLLRWNDIGNKYGQKYILPHMLNGDIYFENLGKVVFDKNGKPSGFPSRLNYFWAWFKKRNI